VTEKLHLATNLISPLAVFSVPGYAFNGVYKEIRRLFGSSVQNYIIAARTAQGYEELASSASAHRQDVISRWKDLQVQHRGKAPIMMNTRDSSQMNRKDVARNSASVKNMDVAQGTTAPPRSINSDLAVSNADDSNDDYDKAIPQFVEDASNGDSLEARMVESAIKASLAELQGPPNH